jgi:acyl dehydratase
LTLNVEVLEARESKSRPTLGIVKFKFSTLNAKGQMISEMTTPIMIGRREAVAGN